MKNIFRRFTCFALLALAFVLPGAVQAQDGVPVPAGVAEKSVRLLQNAKNNNDIRARAVSASVLKTGDQVIELWGVDTPDGVSPVLKLRGQIAMEQQIGGFPIQCEFKGSMGSGRRLAQCVSYQDVDLGLSMVQQGLAVVDRTSVFNTVFEELYLQAESQARVERAGIWNFMDDRGAIQSASNTGQNVTLTALLAFLALAAVVIGYFVKQGFQRLIELQSESIEIFRNEQRLKTKEKYVVASMLASEIESNTSKIEAYLMIYREMSVKLNDPQVTPKYMESGDIVQKQPTLDRNIFDSNTDKLELLTPSLASKLIHFYARIKTKPDYVTLEPDMPRSEAKDVIDQVIRDAETMEEKSRGILKLLDAYRPKQKKPEDQERAEPLRLD